MKKPKKIGKRGGKLSRLGWPGPVKVEIDRPSAGILWRRVFPFRRSWLAICIIAAMAVAFMIPAISAFGEAMEKWRTLDSLFDLTTAVFLTAWVLGWSLGPLILCVTLLLMVTGREVLIARPGSIQLGVGVPGLIVTSRFDPGKISNLRLTQPEPKSGRTWRGTHLSFDYSGRTIHFGSAISPQNAHVLSAAFNKLVQSLPDEPVSEPVRAEPVTRPAAARSPAPGAQTAPGSDATGPGLLSTLALIAANLIPVVGTLLFDWRLSDVMVLYWAESAVIGFYNMLKMLYIGKWLAVFAGLFFLGHFSAFMAVHFLFLYSLFIQGPDASDSADLQEVTRLFFTLWPALLALFLSHGISFVSNFVHKREYRRVTLKQQMTAPYSRIVLMHLTIIFGGFVAMVIGDPVPVILLFILIKLAVDVRAHIKEHNAEEEKGYNQTNTG